VATCRKSKKIENPSWRADFGAVHHMTDEFDEFELKSDDFDDFEKKRFFDTKNNYFCAKLGGPKN